MYKLKGREKEGPQMKRLRVWLVPAGIGLTLAFMLLHPQATAEAALRGFLLWGKVVLPALFPFLAAQNLLYSTGAAAFMAVLLHPAAERVFRLPGAAALPVLMGFTSGFPVGAILTRQLYDERALTLRDAEHLLAFTNNSSPLFLLGSIGAGLLASPEAGLLLLLSLYGGNLLLGLLLRFTHETRTAPRRPSLADARKALRTHRTPAPLGQLMADAIRSAFVSSATVAGFIVIFSVLAVMLSCFGVFRAAAGLLPSAATFSGTLLTGLLQGILEITLGCESAARASAPLMQKLAVITLVCAVGGLSVFAQIMSLMGHIPIRPGRYFLCRIAQTVFSLGLLRLFSGPLLEVPVFSHAMSGGAARLLYRFDCWTASLALLLLSLFTLLLILLCAAFYARS